MTPPESEFLQNLGIFYLYTVEQVTICVFFYGASSSLAVYDSLTSPITGLFVVLFSMSVVIFVFVFSFLPVAHFLARPDLQRFHRRKGFSERLTAVMFAMTVINFLLSSWNTGNWIVGFIVPTQKAFMLNIDYPLSEKRESVNNALRNLTIVTLWSGNLPVSSNLSPLDSMLIHTWWRYYSVISLSFGGLGSFSKIDNG